MNCISAPTSPSSSCASCDDDDDDDDDDDEFVFLFMCILSVMMFIDACGAYYKIQESCFT
jgi:hypothetical protein